MVNGWYCDDTFDGTFIEATQREETVDKSGEDVCRRLAYNFTQQRFGVIIPRFIYFTVLPNTYLERLYLDLSTLKFYLIDIWKDCTKIYLLYSFT